MVSFVYAALTKSAHLLLGRIVVELAAGRNAISHSRFQNAGLPRDSITAAISELETLGVISVHHRPGQLGNFYRLSDQWRGWDTLAMARQARDLGRSIGLTARRKRERAEAREARTERLEQFRAMIGAPQMRGAAFSVLDDVEVAVLGIIAKAIGQSAGVVAARLSYEHFSDQISARRNKLTSALRVLSALGLISIGARGRRTACTYTIGEGWKNVSTVAAAEQIAAAARQPRKRSATTGEQS